MAIMYEYFVCKLKVKFLKIANLFIIQIEKEFQQINQKERKLGDSHLAVMTRKTHIAILCN